MIAASRYRKIGWRVEFHSIPSAIAQLVFVFVLAIAVSHQPVPASAQEAPGLSKLLKKLIRGGQKSNLRKNREARRKTSRRKSNKSSRVSSQNQPEIEIPEKVENARVILVIGDFTASGLAEGLEQAFQTSPGIVIVSETSGSSGLVRDDYYDWNARAPEFIERHKPAAAVIMIGANDRQQMTVGLTKEDVRSEAWNKEYQKRAKDLAAKFAATGIPVVWTGMVPFSSRKATSDILAFNDIYRDAVESVGGQFVDVWDAFVDENGAFVTRGPDINGQIRRLRSDDGINLAKASKRLLAFYAEKPLRKLLGDATASDIASLGPTVFVPAADDPAAPMIIDRTEPISLNDPELDGGLILLGGSLPGSANAPNNASANSKLIEDGIAPQAPAGRADNFQIIPGTGGQQEQDKLKTSATNG